MDTGKTTLLHHVATAVVWNPDRQRHEYLSDADLAFRDGQLIFVGRDYPGEAEIRVDGGGLMAMPGLVNVHCHTADEPLAKGIFDDVGCYAHHGHALYAYGGLLDTDEAGMLAASRAALCELALSGVTSLVDLAVPYAGWLEALASSGLRVWAGPMFREARWEAGPGGEVRYHWDRERGEQGFNAARMIIDELMERPDSLVSPILAPAQADTCSPALLRSALDLARERDLPLTVHAAQTMVEFQEMLRRHGTTTVQWLEAQQLLEERVFFGHGIFMDHHGWTHLRGERDLAIVAARGVGVAHCPTVFARSAMCLESLGRYRNRGVTLGIGTDSYPMNMLEEMRTAVYLARIAGGTVFDTRFAEVFEAATVDGAELLRRGDLGRLAVGCKADLVLVDLQDPAMQPVHDPLRNLLVAAAERAVRHVYVDGRPVVWNGEMLHIDQEAALSALTEAQQQAVAAVSTRDRQGQTLDAIAPRMLPNAD